MKKVLIVGGGVSGLCASYAFRDYDDLEITIMEPNKIGGEFLVGGLKYIHRTDQMASMLIDLGVVFSNYNIKGGILLREEVKKYPDVFVGMNPGEVERIRADHYRKTRRTEPGAFSKKAMNDPASTKPRNALKADFNKMIDALYESHVGRGGMIEKSPLNEIGEKVIYTQDRKMIKFDYLILTIPLWVIKRVAPFWYVPEGVAMKLNVVNITPMKDRYSKWDYVYTPYTPGNSIHRFSPTDDGYSCEINADLQQAGMISDLNYIFKEGYCINSIKQGMKGHLLPLEEKWDTPSNVALLGRFAKWDPRATMDATFDDAIELGKRWFN